MASTLILASNKDVFLVPAMNVRMWSHAATRNNCETLKGYGYRFIGPIKGKWHVESMEMGKCQV